MMNSRFVSLGGNCYISMALRKTGFQKESYPFDWINTFRFREELEFMKDLKANPNILNKMPLSTLNVDAEIIAKGGASYFIEKYKIRLPHEHDLKKDISNLEIIEKYQRRYKRLISDCRQSKHVIFIRTVAHNCYELEGEKVSDYNQSIIRDFVEFLKSICQHSNFTLLILSRKEPLEDPKIDNVVTAQLTIPFENSAFIAAPTLPTGKDADTHFKEAFEKISQSLNCHDVKQFLSYPFKT